MKIIFILVAFFLTSFSITASAAACQKTDAPRVIKPMKDWDIISTNTANISTADVFSGENLVYTVKAKHRKQNKITINKQTGLIKIDAEKKDNFDVKVSAKNKCGVVSNKFNVQIDEEE